MGGVGAAGGEAVSAGEAVAAGAEAAAATSDNICMSYHFSACRKPR